MITFRCSCGKQLKVNEERAGIKVKCPECDAILRVPEASSIKEKSGPPSPPAKTRPMPLDDDGGFAEEERRPRRRSRADDEDDEDRARRRSARYEDEDDDREYRRPQKPGRRGLLISLILGGVLLLAGVGVGLFVFLKSSGNPRELIVGHWKGTEETKRIAKGVDSLLSFTKDGSLRFAAIKNGSLLGDEEAKYWFVNDKTHEFDQPKMKKIVQVTIVSISQDKLVLQDKEKGEKAEFIRVPEFELQRAVRAPGIAAAQDKTILRKNLQQISLAMHSFNDVYKRIPAPGFSRDVAARDTKPLLSWRVAILPYVDEEPLFRQFKLDEPWDGPNNIQLLSKMPKIYQPLGSQPKKDGHTYLQFITGPGTLFPTPTSVAAIPRSFQDGTSITIVVVEAAEPVPWTKPADLFIDVSNIEQGPVPKLGGFSPDGFSSEWAMARCTSSDAAGSVTRPSAWHSIRRTAMPWARTGLRQQAPLPKGRIGPGSKSVNCGVNP